MKKSIFLFLMESCSLGLHAQSLLSPSTTTGSNTAIPSAVLKNVRNTIRFSYDEAGNVSSVPMHSIQVSTWTSNPDFAASLP